MARAGLVIAVVWSLTLSGCGTFSDAMCGPINDHVYYRGVRLDVQAAREGGSNVLMAADIPLSAIVDTLLVPYLAYHELTEPPRKNLHPASGERSGTEMGKGYLLPQTAQQQ
jgi:uncharacterized protein YceK